jgi:hypothetical protein
MIWIIERDMVIGYASLDAARHYEKPVVEISAVTVTSGFEVDVRISGVTIFQGNTEDF